MFIIPDKMLTGASIKFVSHKGLSERTLKGLEANGYRYAVDDEPANWVLFGRPNKMAYFSKEKANYLPLYIKYRLRAETKSLGSFMYLEVCGDSIYVTSFNDQGHLFLDETYDLTISNHKEVIADIRLALQSLRKKSQVTLFIADGNEHIRDLLNQSQRYVDDDRFRRILQETEESRLAVSSEGVIAFGGKETQLNREVEGCLPLFVKTWDNGLVIDLCRVEIFKDPYPECGKSLAWPIDKIRSTRRLVTSTYTSVVGLLAVLIYAVDWYIESQRIAEQQALQAQQTNTVVDPWRAYKQEITNPKKALQAEAAFRQTAYLLKAFENGVRTHNGRGGSVGWRVGEVVASSRHATITPVRESGTRQKLYEFAAVNGLVVTSSTSGLQVNMIYPETAINETAVISSVDDESLYIAESMGFLFDDAVVTTQNKAINGSGEGQYAVHLVKIEFACWQPEDFLYAGTQFAYRNYALHSLNAKMSESLQVSGDSCVSGLSGHINLQVYGR